MQLRAGKYLVNRDHRDSMLMQSKWQRRGRSRLTNADFGDFTLLFCRGRLRNVRFITHTLNYCSALKIFCFATSSFAVAAAAICRFLLSGCETNVTYEWHIGIWQEQAKKDSDRNFEILKIRKLLIDLHSILFNSVQFIIQRLWMTALEKPLEVRSKRF